MSFGGAGGQTGMELQEVIERQVGDTKVPGLVALVAHGEDVQVEAVGNLTIGGPPVKPESLFRIASTTKPITGAATLAAIEAGLLGLDDPVDELLPELADRRVLIRPDGPLNETVPAQRPITIRDLLTFTFGFGMAVEMFTSRERWPIVEADEELGLASINPPDPSVQPDPDTWIANLGSLPLLAQPGERWLYNTGASVLGVLLARAAGQPFGEALRTLVLEPLGMRNTTFWTSDTDRLATAYRPTPDGLVVWDEPGGTWSRSPAFEDGAAGLLSTVEDLYAFAQMLTRGGAPVLSAESARAMTTDQLPAAVKARGGLGPDFFKGRSWSFCQAVYNAGAFGWDGGFGSSWLVDPVNDLTVIVLTQRAFETSDLPRVHREIQAAAYASLT
ncbi:MAG TPA: serine hydrolase domain-containing protein [Solirubrobacteraceae bacterium]|nr:serine hydrolase domain-containing protein [Solirubrobacteraceae bacterium]